MLGIEKELGIFIHAVLSGIIVYTVYMCLRILRRLVKHGLLVIGIEDLLFWLGTALYLFVQIYHTSDGSIRWFFVLGVVVGMVFSAAVTAFVKKRRKKDLH